MDEKERLEEKERQKEKLRKLAQEVAAQQQQRQLEVEERANDLLENIHETMEATQKILERLPGLEGVHEETKPDRSHLRLVPPLEKTDDKEDTTQ